MEPSLLQHLANGIEDTLLKGSEELEDPAELLEGDHVVGVHSVSSVALSLGDLGKDGLQTLEVEMRDGALLDGGTVGDLEPVAEGVDEVVPGDSVLGEEVTLPELATTSVSDGSLDDDVLKGNDDLTEGGTTGRVLIPATFDEATKGVKGVRGDDGTFVADTHGLTELVQGTELAEGLLACQDLPQHDSEGVHVTAFVELSEHHNL